MTRPLMSRNIVQLEELFAASSGDDSVLKQLQEELSYRKVPRALALRELVRAALYLGDSSVATTQKTSSSSTSSQQALCTIEAVSPPQPTIQNTRPHLAPNRATPQPTWASVPTNTPLVEISSTQSNVSISVEDAYRVLKVTPSSTWEVIELSRRQIVQQAHPDNLAGMGTESRMQALTRAQSDLVNFSLRV